MYIHEVLNLKKRKEAIGMFTAYNNNKHLIDYFGDSEDEET